VVKAFIGAGFDALKLRTLQVTSIRRGVFVARFDVTGKFEDLKAGTGNSEGSTLLVQ